ncbi:hypothetical protein EOD42_20220 [Rhodovarius crocodyli]|uniref:Uncharacterized protein n=1 Tax=Rhodovarius crocodyli TaxID=1979269 RepID=A0A437M2Y9_9PROT|nr:hypothetical protein [Rhodovarius crocodyli]RVT92058.1 hypothetical protein EOD42_20220 [Rhodovarius crocodyli]
MARRRLKRAGLDLEEQTRLVAEEYRNFLAGNAAFQDLDTSKLFLARHNAAKAALSHLEALMKLGDAGQQAPGDNLSAIVARARAALAGDKPEDTTGEPEADT